MTDMRDTDRASAVHAELATTVLRAVWRRLTRGPMDPAWSWRTSITRDVLTVLGRRAVDLPPWTVPVVNRLLVGSTPVDLRRVVRTHRADLDGVPAEVLSRPSADRTILMYLHGGAYLVGSARTVRPVTSWLTWVLRCRTYAIDYRLAPVHPFPAALDDSLRAYRSLIEYGVDPSTVVLAGDSAGGGLTVATLVAARDAGLPMPAAAVLLSPWTDLTAAGGSLESNRGFDYLPAGEIPYAVSLVVGDADPADPRVSPVYGDLSGLPPLLVFAGGREVLLDSIRHFVSRARDQDVEAELVVHQHMFHDWLPTIPGSPDAMLTVERISDFVRSHLDGSATRRAGADERIRHLE